MKSFSDYGITVPSDATGEVKTTCPKCSGQRKKKNYPCLNVNTHDGVWHCWHCDWAGGLKQGTWQEAQIKPVYSRPATTTRLVNDFWRNWLLNRGITAKTIEKYDLTDMSIYMPQVQDEASAIRFPYTRDGELVNCKYRDKDKNFCLHKGAERLLYGYDDIDDECLVWVEGEMDKLSMYEAGIVSCVSVPDGAPAPGTKNYSSKFDYFDKAADRLSLVKRHIIAVDNDAPGMTLQAELLRRLNPAICYTVVWPSGCKDANDVLRYRGRQSLAEVVQSARPAPIEGIFYLEDAYDRLINLYQNGVVGGIETGWDNLAGLYSVRAGDFAVVTGIPGHGKSEWVDGLMVNIAKTTGWRFAIFSPENQPIELHIKKLAEKWTGRPFFEQYNDRMTVEELNEACEEMRHYFSFILPEEPTIDCILEKTKQEILRRGVNGLIIDPWNECEHSRPASMTETEYISACLGKLRQFARRHNIALWIVAHPTKMQRVEKGSPIYEVPTPYDIAGSANWRNKADNCITIYRNAETTDVHIQKIRVKEVGRVGTAAFKYKISTGEYFPVRGA
jgi:twinkle protein